jgi:3-hydroxy-9,10-secoandrosta-1,3,5(10)-triene-9,17-dione monooxygenase
MIPVVVTRLAERASEDERLRRLPQATVDDLVASKITDLLVPARFGGREAAHPEILRPVRELAHGCASSAWTIGFYVLHNWLLAPFDERAQAEGFADRPSLAPAPLAPTGRGRPALALLPIGDVTVEDVWETDRMRDTGSNDVVIDDVFVPSHRLGRVIDIYAGTRLRHQPRTGRGTGHRRAHPAVRDDLNRRRRNT